MRRAVESKIYIKLDIGLLIIFEYELRFKLTFLITWDKYNYTHTRDNIVYYSFMYHNCFFPLKHEAVQSTPKPIWYKVIMLSY